MICKNCNQIIDDDAKFCPNCGSPQNTEAKQQHLTQEQLVQQAGQQQSAQEQPTQEQPTQEQPMQQEPSQVSQQPSQATQQPYTQQSPPPGDGQGKTSQVYYYQQESQDHGYQSVNSSQYNSSQYNSSPYNSSGYNEEMINSTPYLIFAIITTILCCLPLGIPAIMFAAKINSAQRAGAIDVAKIYARKAKMFTICAAALGVVLWTCFIGIMVIGSVASYYQY